MYDRLKAEAWKLYMWAIADIGESYVRDGTAPNWMVVEARRLRRLHDYIVERSKRPVVGP